MKERGLGKKGQEMSITTMVILVLAIIVLVVIVLGFTQGWGYIFDKLNLLPNDLTAMANACKTYAETPGLELSYCEFREGTIDGVKGYWNCDKIKEIASATLSVDELFDGPTCSNSPEEFCKTLGKGSATINNLKVTCSTT